MNLFLSSSSIFSNSGTKTFLHIGSFYSLEPHSPPCPAGETGKRMCRKHILFLKDLTRKEKTSCVLILRYYQYNHK